MQVPVIMFDERKADRYFEVYSALIRQQNAQPELKGNFAWRRMVAKAYNRFFEAFERA